MTDKISKVTSTLLGAESQSKTPFATAGINPCLTAAPGSSSELTVLFPVVGTDPNGKTIPAMGGSIVKLSFGTADVDSTDKKHKAYVSGILSKESKLFGVDQTAVLATKHTSAVRVAVSKLYTESIFSDVNLDVVPNLYLSSTIAAFDTLDTDKDYFGTIRKNAKFAFVPIEVIQQILLDIKSNDVLSKWTSLSGKTFTELYDISKSSSPSDKDIASLILDMLPFVNLSDDDMLKDSSNPPLAGYFTIINNAIYLKMPDFSGFDSAGYGSNYFETSELNFLFQIIQVTEDSSSVKNIEIKTQVPIFADVTDYTETYDLKVGGDFLVTFTANTKPKHIYLSPVVNGLLSIKNDPSRGILATQSSTFIEYSPFPNPFAQIFSGEIVEKDKYATGIDFPFSKVISDKIVGGFSAGFPLNTDVLLLTRAVGTQSLSTYELIGNLSRQNLILHNGIAANDVGEKSTGNRSNNSKYLKKEFISNQIGLCENYRPRVFSSATNLMPLPPWIMSPSGVKDNGDGTFTSKWSKNDILSFFTDFQSEDVTEMRFVVYAWDGDCQVSKMSNGYLIVSKSPADITSIKPNGTQVDGLIVTCAPATSSETSRITISTDSAASVDSIKIGEIIIRESDTAANWAATSSSISVDIPCTVSTGLQDIVVTSGTMTSEIVKINISGAEITSIADLPLKIDDVPGLSPEEAAAFSASYYEIPICYGDLRSKIRIKNSRSAFKRSELYLYLGFSDPTVAGMFSVDVVEAPNKIFVAKDFYYKLSTLLGADFYKQSKTTANLYFPGTENSNDKKPLSLLADYAKTAYFVISSRAPSQFRTTDNLGIITLGDSSHNAFVASPLVIGMAAKYTDGTISNDLGTFGANHTDYSAVSNAIIAKEFGYTSLFSGNNIPIKDKFTKLAILFKYRELKKFKKKNFKLYIKDAKVGNAFLLDGVSPVTSLGSDFTGTLYSQLYYLVVTNVSVTSASDAPVRIDIWDPDFSINNTTQNKFNDLVQSFVTGDVTPPNATTGSIVINKETIVLPPASSSVQTYPLGNYGADFSLTGLFADKTDSGSYLINFGSHPMVAINSTVAADLMISGADESNIIHLSKSVDSDLVSDLPYGVLRIPSGAEVSSGNYLASAAGYLVFIRIEVPDVCKLASLTPKILSIDKTSNVSPGEKLVMRVENILQTFIVEISGIEAKVVRVSTGDDGISEVTVIIPEGITSIVTTDCGIKLYNGNQVLNSGINQFGKGLVGILDRQASGMLNQITNQFDKWKDKLLDHPLKFISNLMNHANIEKQFMTDFCNFSFKLTANLSVNLQGFSQLLVPVRVILCIIDVICNILNPFQLPAAIIRLFDCLYDLILLLPQISIPVMFLSLLLHLLDLLECLIVKILGLITIINLVIDAMIQISSGVPNFRDLLLLEELLMKYVISLEGDLEILGPIVQILAIFLELLNLTFRFPCSINPNSLIAPCGIDGFEIGAMVSGMIAEQTGEAPHATYIFKKQYLIPVSQPFTKIASEVATAPSYNNATEPTRGGTVFDGSAAIDQNLYDLSFFNPNSLRKKNTGFDSTTDDITDITTDTYVSLAASYTKRRKTFESSQSVIFKFDGRSWKSAIFPDLVDKQVIDETKAFDTPVVLLSKDSPNLDIAATSAHGNFYSLMDGKEMMGPVVDGVASIIPLTIDIIQDGVAVPRTFDTIPAMLLLDEEFNVYVVNEGGIIFGEYKQLDGTSVTGISEIRATVINRQSSHRDAFEKEDEVIGTDDGTESGTPITKSIFSLPQLYFVDTRVAAEIIQSKCQTASINQLPLDLSGDGGLSEVQAVTSCLQDFLNSITTQTAAIKSDLVVGKIPNRMSPGDVDAAYGTLLACTNGSIDNVCAIVVNPLNSSFLLEQDTDLTPILPDPATLSADLLAGFESSGPAFTGAREYAGGIGDAVTLTVGTNAKIEVIPRDSYDNLIFFDMSDKIRIDIVSDTTGSASLILIPTDLDAQNYLVYDSITRSYSASLSASSSGEVKIKASVCNQPIQALTYSDLVDLTPTDAVGCVPSAVTVAVDNNSVALGALSRINRILTITFVDKTASVITGSASDQGIIITDPQLFGSGLVN